MPNPRGKFEFTAKDLTKEAFKSVGSNLKKVTGSIFSMKTALIAVAGGAGFGAMIASSLKSIDVLGKTADRIGITTEGLAKMQLAAGIAGVANTTLTKSLQKMIVNINDTATGTSEASDAFAVLGINAKELIELNPEEQFGEISEALNTLENNTQRVSAAYDIFGGRGTELLNIVKLGKDGLAEIGKEAELFGLTMSRETVAGVEDANDAITRLGGLFKGFSNQLTSALAPAIEDVVTAFKNFLLKVTESEGGIRGFASAFAIDLLKGFKAGIDGIKKFLEFVDSAKAKLIEWGIIDNTAAEQRIAGLEGTIKNLEKSIKIQAKFNEGGAEHLLLIEQRAAAQALLNQELGGEVGFLDLTSAAIQKLIDQEVQRQALRKAGLDEPPPKKPAGGGDGKTKALGLTQSEIDTRLEGVKKFLSSQTEAIAASLLTDDEQLLLSHERRSLMVEEAAARDLISTERKNEIIKKLDAKLATDQLDIKKKQQKSETALQISGLKGASSIAKSLVQLVGSGSKKKFELGKKLSKASVVMDTAAAIMRAYADLGPIGGTVAAIGIGIAGLAQLANINRTQFGGGGGISAGGVTFPTPTAGNPPPAIAPTNGLPGNLPGSAINITIQGNVLGNEEFVEGTLVPILQDAINNNDTVLINGNSAQALELAS